MKRREFLATTLALPALAQPPAHTFSTHGVEFAIDSSTANHPPPQSNIERGTHPLLEETIR